jgi:hypothetical protein
VNVDVPHPKLCRFLSGLLGGTLTGKRSAFSASLEAACSSTGPTKGVTFGVRNRHGCVVEGRVNVSDAIGDIATNAFLFV